MAKMAYNPYLGIGGMMAGGGIGQMISPWQNPAKGAMGTLDQIPDELKQYYDPYIGAGQQQMGNLQGQYGQMTGDPGQLMNQLGSGFQGSPGFQFSLQQALQGSDHAAAAGGMAGSPMHEQKNMQLATNLGNQYYNQYLQNVLGLYGKGISGEQDMFHTGYNASNELGQSVGNTELSKALLQYQAQNAANQHKGGGLGSLLGGAGMLMGFL